VREAVAGVGLLLHQDKPVPAFGELAGTVVAAEDPSTSQHHAVGRAVADEALLEAMLTDQAEVVGEDLLRRPAF